MPTFDQGNSTRWRIFNAVATALETAPALQAVPVKRAPTQALTLKKGEYTIVTRWNADSFVERVGNDERRRFALVVASIVCTEHSDRDADAMHSVVGQLLRGLMPTLNDPENGIKEVSLRETEVTSFSEDFQPIEGGLVLSAFEITYRQPANPLQQ